MKKTLIVTAILATASAAISTSASAALASDSTLAFDSFTTTTTSSGSVFVTGGSFFAMDTNGSGTFTKAERAGLIASNGIELGTAQAAGSIDQTWGFFGADGNHVTSVATTVSNAVGNTADVDFSGWTVAWNGVSINMGSGDSAGVASVVCDVDCAVGDGYTLDYFATVPNDGLTDFGGVKYTVHLVGTVAAAPSAVPVPAAAWLFGSGLLGLVGVARRRKAS